MAFECVENRNLRSSAESDPLASRQSLRDLSRDGAESFSVAHISVIAAFRFEHWVDGRPVRVVSQREQTRGTEVSGDAEPWERGIVRERSVLASVAYDAVLRHYGVREPRSRAEEASDRLLEDPRGEVQRTLRKITRDLERAVHRMESATDPSTLFQWVEGIHPNFLERTLGRDPRGLESLGTSLERVRMATVAAAERIGSAAQVDLARRDLVTHWLRRDAALDDALALARSLTLGASGKGRAECQLREATILARMQRPSDAIAAARSAIASATAAQPPTQIASLLARAAELAVETGDAATAIRWLRRAKTLAPRSARTHQKRIEALRPARDDTRSGSR